MSEQAPMTWDELLIVLGTVGSGLMAVTKAVEDLAANPDEATRQQVMTRMQEVRAMVVSELPARQEEGGDGEPRLH